MPTLFELPQPSLSIHGQPERFPVGRIVCVGRNYPAHAQEMGSSGSEPPFFFMKPASAVHDLHVHGGQWPYPSGTIDCHHELELVLAMGPVPEGRCVPEIWGIALGVDMTRRDRQAAMKAAGKPWELGKAFAAAAPATPILPLTRLAVPSGARPLDHLASASLGLWVNGELRQTGRPEQMLCSIESLLAEIDREFGLMPGDLVFTGTPAGVAAVQPGDCLVGRLQADGQDLLQPLELKVTAAGVVSSPC